MTTLGSAAELELPFEFTRITGIFELADGRAVVVDGGDATIFLADFERRSASPLGRHGSGPGEYRVPMFIYPLGGDSLGILDDAAGRLLVVTRDGRPGGFLSPRAEDTRRGFAVAARFGDGRGFFYGEGASIGVAQDGKAQVVDSAPILRWRAGSGPPSVLTYVRRPKLAGTRVEGGSLVVLPPGARRTALSSRALWAVAGDGRIAVVDPAPYRVTLVSPAGERIATTSIPYTRVAVTDSVKRAYLAEHSRAQTIVLDRGSGAASTMRSSRPAPTPSSWVDAVPPFRPEALVAFDGRGVLWIQRTTFGREGALYDLVGRAGNLLGTIRLPEGHRVVGFGREKMYVIRRDADDLEHLQRRPLPPRR